MCVCMGGGGGVTQGDDAYGFASRLLLQNFEEVSVTHACACLRVQTSSRVCVYM